MIEQIEKTPLEPVGSGAWLGRVKRFLVIFATYLSILMVGAGLALIGPWAMITAGFIGLIVVAWIMSK